MAFFADLTPHSYSPTGGLEILNIGWLDNEWPYSKGPTSQEFQDALSKLCARPIILHRGFHVCQYCKGGKGNGQIRVLGKNGIWYAAPTLVHHYVTRHDYCPPDGFVDAVLSPIAVGNDCDWHD